MPHQDVERFNAQASSYDSGWRQWVVAPVHKATLEFAASLNPRPREVLDVGCGTGALLRRAASRCLSAERAGVGLRAHTSAHPNLPRGVRLPRYGCELSRSRRRRAFSRFGIRTNVRWRQAGSVVAAAYRFWYTV